MGKQILNSINISMKLPKKKSGFKNCNFLLQNSAYLPLESCLNQQNKFTFKIFWETNPKQNDMLNF